MERILSNFVEQTVCLEKWAERHAGTHDAVIAEETAKEARIQHLLAMTIAVLSGEEIQEWKGT